MANFFFNNCSDGPYEIRVASNKQTNGMTLSILTICFVIYPSVRTRIHTMGNKKNTRGITEFLSS